MSDRVRFHCDSGSKVFPIFEYDENGELVDTGKKDNVFERIQSYKDEVLLSNIIKRCGLTGESLVANPDNFGDTTVLPKSLLEMKENQDKVQGFVNSLSKSDLDLLNEKGFDDFISAKIAEKMSAQKAAAKKDGDNNE